MISLPGLFLALAGTAMLAALVALWNSVRSAFGGGPGVLVETARDLPDHAQLVEEKHALLRAIKDLEYERAVGKIGDDDFRRLDTAYRARAKQVLAQLDRDVKPLYEEAERLIDERLGAGSKPKKKRSKKDEAEAESAPAKGPTLDEVLAAIRAGSVTEAPKPPAHWPSDAQAMWTSSIERALAEKGASKAAPPEKGAKAEASEKDAATTGAAARGAEEDGAAHEVAVVSEAREEES